MRTAHGRTCSVSADPSKRSSVREHLKAGGLQAEAIACVALPNNSQALAWQAEGSMGDAAWAPSAPQAPLREEGDELWPLQPPSTWTSGASGNRNYGEAGSEGPCSRWVSRRPCLWHAVCKCEMPLRMKQTPAGRVVSHSLTTHTTTREWVFYLPIRTFSLN